MKKLDPNSLRLTTLEMIWASQSGHIGSSFSMAEIIAALYNSYPGLVEKNQDKLILSKGHGVPMQYAALYELDLLGSYDAKHFRELSSLLQGHPVHLDTDYIHATTGSLGQGLSIALGHALAYQRLELPYKVFCIVGDGELQEGQIWEALLSAPEMQLDNLVCIIDYNEAQNDGKLAFDYTDHARRLLGWDWAWIDGHNMLELYRVLDIENQKRPKLIVASTSKNKGIEILGEDRHWHGTIPNLEEYVHMVALLKEKIHAKS